MHCISVLLAKGRAVHLHIAIFRILNVGPPGPFLIVDVHLCVLLNALQTLDVCCQDRFKNAI